MGMRSKFFLGHEVDFWQDAGVGRNTGCDWINPNNSYLDIPRKVYHHSALKFTSKFLT